MVGQIYPWNNCVSYEETKVIRRWTLAIVLVGAAGFGYFRVPASDEFQLGGVRLGESYSDSSPGHQPPQGGQAVVVGPDKKVVSITGTDLRYRGKVYAPKDWELLHSELRSFKAKQTAELLLLYPSTRSFWILCPFQRNEFVMGVWPPPRGVVERCGAL